MYFCFIERAELPKAKPIDARTETIELPREQENHRIIVEKAQPNDARTSVVFHIHHQRRVGATSPPNYFYSEVIIRHLQLDRYEIEAK